MADKTVVILHHAPITLRVDEMVPGELGIPAARQKFEFTLAEGRNEVDAEMWKAWFEQNKAGPLVTGGIISVEEQDKSHGEPEQSPQA